MENMNLRQRQSLEVASRYRRVKLLIKGFTAIRQVSEIHMFEGIRQY